MGPHFAGVTPPSEVPGNGLTTSSTAVTTILSTPSSPGELFLALIDASGHFRYTLQSADGSTTGWAPIPGSVASNVGPNRRGLRRGQESLGRCGDSRHKK